MLSWPPATTILAVPSSDLLRAERDGAQARAAELVQAPGRASRPECRRDRRLARRVLAGAGGQHLAQDDFVDVGRLDAGALERGLDGDLAELVRRQAGQRAVERADRGAGGADDDDRGGILLHVTFPPSGLGLVQKKQAIRNVATLAIVAGVQAVSHCNVANSSPKKAPLRASPGHRSRRLVASVPTTKLTAQTTGERRSSHVLRFLAMR